MPIRKSLPIAAALLGALMSSSSSSYADSSSNVDEVVWSVTDSLYYVDPANSTLDMIRLLRKAKDYLAAVETKNKTLVLQFPSGTYNFISNSVQAIAIDDINVDAFATGRLILRGIRDDNATPTISTILQFNRFDQEGIRISNSNRITIQNMHLTRDKHYVSQGDVVSVTPGWVTFQVHDGFPDPAQLFLDSGTHADSDDAERNLMGFRGPDIDPKLDPSYPRVPITGMQCNLTPAGTTLCEAELKDPTETPLWPRGQHVAFRSKVGQPTVFVLNSDDVTVEDVRFTRLSLVPIRFSNGCDGPVLRRVTVDRSDDVINGRVPFYSSPAGGPQIDTAARGPTIQDCKIIGVGDDGIAVFTDNDASVPTSGTLIEGNTVRDNLGRGILLNGGNDRLKRNVCRNNTLIRNMMSAIASKNDGQVSNDWDIYSNTFIQPWIDPVILFSARDATLHQNIRIFNNLIVEAPMNNHLLFVDKTDNLEFFKNTVISFSNEDDYNVDLDPHAHSSAPQCIADATCSSLVYVRSGLNVQGWGNTYPQSTARTTTAQDRSNDDVNVQWSEHSLPEPASVHVAEDTYLNSVYPTSNYGALSYMKVQHGPNRNMYGLVKFNVAGVIPEGHVVLSAKLKVRVHASANPIVNPRVYHCPTNDWSENGATFSHRPAMGKELDSKTGTFPAGTTLEFDVADIVKANETYSFYLWNRTNDGGYYSTKEDNEDNENNDYRGAQLEIITYTKEEENPPTFVNDSFAKPNALQDNPYIGSIAYDAYDTDGDIYDPITGDIYDSSSGYTVFSKVSGPAWLSIAGNGTLSGTPSSSDVGYNDFVVRVTDKKGHSATATMTINVAGMTTYGAVADEDGFVLESSENSDEGGTMNSTGPGLSALRLGDNAANKQYMAIVSIDTSGIPDGATIESATLRLKRGMVEGAPCPTPYAQNLGEIWVDIQGGNGFSGSAALQTQDFEALSSTNFEATLPETFNNGDWLEIPLTATGLGSINKTGSTQMRLRFDTDDDDDGTADYLGFYSGDNSTAANRPQLVVVYH